MIEINWNPSRGDLRIFSLLLIVFFGAIAAWLYFRHDAIVAAAIVLSVATVLGIACLLLPALARWVYVGWMAAAFPVGFVVTHVILAVAFYGVFTPFGLIMRLCGYDPMRRKFDPDAETYWIRRGELTKPEQYFRQF